MIKILIDWICLSLKGVTDLGRKSDYTRLKKKDTVGKEARIKNKLNKESIRSSDLATILGYDIRSVSSKLNKFCEANELDPLRFKKGKNYEFDQEWNGILTTLLSLVDLPKYDKRFTQNSLIETYDHSRILLENIDKYLSDEDQKLVKSHLCYTETLLERQLYDMFMDKVTGIICSLGFLPHHLQTQTIIEFTKILDPVPHQLSEKYVAYLMNNAKKKEKNEDINSENEIKITEDSLEDYLISILKARLNNQEIPEKTYTDEEYAKLLFEQLFLNDMQVYGNDALNDFVKEAREKHLERKEINDTLMRVKAVLDEDKAYDELVGKWVENMLISVSTVKSVSDENKDLGEEILRQIITNEGLRLLTTKTNFHKYN